MTHEQVKGQQKLSQEQVGKEQEQVEQGQVEQEGDNTVYDTVQYRSFLCYFILESLKNT